MPPIQQWWVLTSSDVDGSAVTYSITAGNDNAIFAIDATTGKITVNDRTQLDHETVETHNLTVEVSDEEYQANATVSVNVTDANDTPDIENQTFTLAEDETDGATVGTVVASDTDGDNLTYSITAGNNDGIFAIDTETGEISLADSSQIDFETTESYDLTVEVSDSITGRNATVTVNITDVNEAPEFSRTAPVTATEDVVYTYDIVIADPDAGETLTITAPVLPGWLTFSDNGDGTATLSGTPGNDAVGNYAVELQVQDAAGVGESQSFTVAVSNVNDAPTITGTSNTTVDEDSSYSFIPTGADIDGDDLSFSIENQPDWATFDTATGELSGTPENEEVGITENIIISATDGLETVELDPFSLEVVNVNDAPEISSTAPLTATQSSAYTYNIVVNDPDVGDNVTITATTLPDWLTLTDNGDSTATLSGTPSQAELGDHTVGLQVEDSVGEVDSQSFTLNVKNTNDAPTIAGTPDVIIDEGNQYSFIPTAEDIDGDVLSFSIENKPDWATFNTATGELSGTPENEDVGTTENIIISTSDGTATAILDAFSLEVGNVNNAPEIVSITLNNTDPSFLYNYDIVVNDTDVGDNLTITATNLPDWLTLTDNGDGTATLNGTPDNDTVSGHTIDIQVEDSAGEVDSQSLTLKADGEKLKNIVSDLIEDLPQFANTFLDGLLAATQFNFESVPNGFELTYLDSFNVTDIINKLSAEIGLDLNLSTPLNVTGPSIRIAKDELGDPVYGFSATEVSIGEMVNFITNILGTTLPPKIQKYVESLGKVGFDISESGIYFSYLEDLTIDLNSLVEGNGELIKNTVNQLADGLLGDGDSSAEGTQLVLSEATIELINQEDSKELNLSGSLNETNFGIKIQDQDVQFEFEMPSLDKEKLKNVLSDLIGEIPEFGNAFLDVLAIASNFKFESLPDGFSIVYQDDLNITSIINTLSSAIGLDTNLSQPLTVTQPALTVTKDETGKRIYEFSVSEFSPAEIINFITDVVGVSLPDAVQSQLDQLGNASLTLSNQGIALTYLDDLTLDLNNLLDSGGEFIKNVVNNLAAGILGDGDPDTEGTQLVLAQPSVEFIKQETSKQFSFAGSFNGTEFGVNVDSEGVGFAFDIPSIDANQLKDTFSNLVGELPGFANTFLDAIAASSNLKFESYPDGFEISYQDTLNITSIINTLSSTIGLGIDLAQPLNVTEPSLRVNKDEAGNRTYEFSVGEISPTEVVYFLTDIVGVSLPSNIQSKLDSIGNASFTLSNTGIALTYLDDLTLDVNSLIGGDIGFLEDAVNKVTAAFLGDGDPNKPGTQLVLSQPELEFMYKDSQKEFGFAGSFNGADFDINLAGQEIEFAFEMPPIDVEKLKELVYDIAGQLPEFITTFLDIITDANLKIESNADGLEIAYLDTINIQSVINTLTSAIGLGSPLNEPLNVTKPSLKLTKDESGSRSFELTVGEISPGEVVEFITSLAGTSLPENIQEKLNSIGNASFTLSSQGISLTYLDDLSLDLNNLIGNNLGSIPFIQDAVNVISETILGDGDPEKEGTQLVLAQPELEFKTQNGQKSFGLSGSFNGQPFEIGVADGNLLFDYELGNLDFSSLKIPGLSDFNLESPNLTFSEASQFIEHETLGRIKIIEGFNFTGAIDFTENTDAISEFINYYLGVDRVGVHVGLNPSTGASLKGILAGNIPLLSIGDFGVKLNNAGLKFEATPVEVNAAIEGSITLEGYDPVQKNEPPLTLSGDLTLDPKGITGSFQMKTEDGLSWDNPFGLQDTSLRNLAIQIGASYITPWIDNVGFVGDLKFGEYDLKTAFLIDTNDPQKFALELTVNEPLSFMDIYMGPVYSYVLRAVGNEVPIIQQGVNFLDSIIDLTVVSIDGPDEDDQLDPLISIVPVETTIAQETLSQGISINAAVTGWGKTGTLTFDVNPFSFNPSMEGSLKIPEIDLGGIVKISGVENPVSGGTDNDLNLDLKVSLTEQYFRGDGRLEILGHEVAKADFEITPTSINIRDFDLDLGVVAFDVDDFQVNPTSFSTSGYGYLEFLGHEVAKADFEVSPASINIRDFDLDLGVVAFNVDDFQVNPSNFTASGSGEVSILGQDILTGQFQVNNNNFTASSYIGYNILGVGVGVNTDISVGLIDNSLELNANFLGMNQRLYIDIDRYATGPDSIYGWAKDYVKDELAAIARAAEAAKKVYDLSKKVVGSLFNGYIEDAEVFFDANLNGIRDINEPFTMTEADGSYEFPVSWEEYDLNQNGIIDPTEGLIVAQGGTYVSTGLPLEAPLTAVPGYEVVTPLTTLVAELSVLLEIEPEVAELQVKSALGLPEDINLGTFNYLEAIANGDANGLKAYAASVQVQNTLVTLTKVLEGAVPESSVSAASLAAAALGGYAIASQVTEGQSFDLSQPETLQIILESTLDAASDEDAAIDPEQLSEISEIVVQAVTASNQQIEQVANSEGDLTELAIDITQLEKVALGDIAESLSQLAAGTKTLEEFVAETTPEAIQAKIAETVVSDPTFRPEVVRDDTDEDTENASGSSRTGSANRQFLGSVIGSGSGNASETSGFDLSAFIPEIITPVQPIMAEMTANTIEATVESDMMMGNGTDPMYLLEGNDTLMADLEDNWVNGNQGNDMIDVGAGNDTVYGGKDNDTAFGSADNDWMNGNKGADFLDGGEGTDTLYGGEDNDILQGNAGNDWLSGNKGADFLDGGEGMDTVYGGQDGDSLQGGADNDELFGNIGADLMEGNDGNDLLYGGQESDTMSGNDGNDTVSGDRGNDLLDGNTGNDIISGGQGDDTLDGGEGNDQLMGNMGDDILFGAGGADTLTGGIGQDQFVLTLTAGNHLITDFTDGEDLIVLADRLTFEQLTIKASANATIIQLGDEVIATLNSVESSLITADDFTHSF
ncbi:MAG: putative Ig domain-containing protein [Microcoleaceae cyanobacterium]